MIHIVDCSEDDFEEKILSVEDTLIRTGLIDHERLIIFNKIDLILSPAMGGIIIGYEIGRILKKETIFCERIKGKFTLRRGFKIKKNSKVLIIEDVITTGKSSMECVKLIKKARAKLVGFASLIDRSTKKTLKIKSKIISELKIEVPTYKKSDLPRELKLKPITTPGSRFIK